MLRPTPVKRLIPHRYHMLFHGLIFRIFPTVIFCGFHYQPHQIFYLRPCLINHSIPGISTYFSHIGSGILFLKITLSERLPSAKRIFLFPLTARKKEGRFYIPGNIQHMRGQSIMLHNRHVRNIADLSGPLQWCLHLIQHFTALIVSHFGHCLK